MMDTQPVAKKLRKTWYNYLFVCKIETANLFILSKPLARGQFVFEKAILGNGSGRTGMKVPNEFFAPEELSTTEQITTLPATTAAPVTTIYTAVSQMSF